MKITDPLEIIVSAIRKDFPELVIQEKDDNLVCIPAKNPEVGDICIEDYVDDECIVYLGHFAHWHVGCYEDDLNDIEKAQFIAKEITEMFKLLFNDEVIMWGNKGKDGGFYIKGEKPNSKSLFGKQSKEWVWSGPLSS